MVSPHRLEYTGKLLMKLKFFISIAWICSHLVSGSVLAQEKEPAEFQFGFMQVPGGQNSPRDNGFSRLAWEIRKRTSISASLDIVEVDPSTDSIFKVPFIVWQGEAAFPALSPLAVGQIRQFLSRGGTLLIDLSDGNLGGGFDQSVKRELARILPGKSLKRVPPEHVLYKSFFLLERHGGRIKSRAHLEGINQDGRLSVIHYANDMSGAMARDEFGSWRYSMSSGGENAREMTYRLGINLVMYALCLDYKEDQVHIPFILQRRR